MLIHFSNVLLYVILEAIARNSVNVVFFGKRVLNAWNCLSDHTVTSPTVACFKHRIAKLKFMLYFCFYFQATCYCSFILPLCPVDIFALFFVFYSAYLSHINLIA